MEKIRVQSSNIQSIGYDTESGVLEVEFNSGDVYQYLNISESVYQQFLTARSYGEFLNENIRYNYRYQKVR